jgi:hypothetical protein
LFSLNEWAIDWVLTEFISIKGDLDQLFVDSLGLGVGHTGGPELHWDGTSWHISLLVVSIGSCVLLKSIKGIIELLADGLELLVVVGGITSGNEVVEGLLGLLLELSNFSCELFLISSLLVPPLLSIWLEVFFDEFLSISTSSEDILLESLKGGTINDLVWVLEGGSGLGSDSGGQSNVC